MKYIIIDDCSTDLYTEEFNDKEKAVNQAKAEWDRLSDYDKSKRTAFYVIESVNSDEDAEDHLDGTPILTLK